MNSLNETLLANLEAEYFMGISADVQNLPRLAVLKDEIGRLKAANTCENCRWSYLVSWDEKQTKFLLCRPGGGRTKRQRAEIPCLLWQRKKDIAE